MVVLKLVDPEESGGTKRKLFTALPLRKAYLKSFESKVKSSIVGQSENTSISDVTGTEGSTKSLSTSVNLATKLHHALERFSLDTRIIDEAKAYVNALEEREAKRTQQDPTVSFCTIGHTRDNKSELLTDELIKRAIRQPVIANIESLLHDCNIQVRGGNQGVPSLEGCIIHVQTCSPFSCDSCPQQIRSTPPITSSAIKDLILEKYNHLLKSPKLLKERESVVYNLQLPEDRKIFPLVNQITQDINIVDTLENLLTNARDDYSTTEAKWKGKSCANGPICWWSESFRHLTFLRRMLLPMTVDCHKCGTSYELFESNFNQSQRSKGTTNGEAADKVTTRSDFGESLIGVSLIQILMQIEEFLPCILKCFLTVLQATRKELPRCASPVSVPQMSVDSSSPESDVYQLIESHLQCLGSDLPVAAQSIGKKLFQLLYTPSLENTCIVSSSHIYELNLLLSNEGSRLSNVDGALDSKSLLLKGMRGILDSVLETNDDFSSQQAYSLPLASGSKSASLSLVDKRVKTLNLIEHRKILLERIQAIKKAALLALESMPAEAENELASEVKTKTPHRQAKVVSQERADSNTEMFMDSSDISREDFIATSYYLNHVNDLFQKRSIYPGQEPRMPLKHIRVTEIAQQRMHQILFQSDGSLRPETFGDVDVSAENDPRYINFGNTSETGRKDLRFQVGLKKQIMGGFPIRAREKINEIFVELGVIDQEHESLHEIGILVGGTEDQSLHHDCARRFVKWYPEPLTGKETKKELAAKDGIIDGFEIDRLRYNTVMSSPHAPSSMLVALGSSGEMLVGVQKDRIMRETQGGKWCSIEGADGARYEIVRESDTLVVLLVKGGVIFTGDFPHCGVRNFSRGTREDEMLNNLNQKIQKINEEYATRPLSRSRAIVEMLGRFPGLDQLSRLHCSTKTHDCSISIPFNMIGYAECFSNQRDDRCFAYETNKFASQSWQNTSS